MEKFILKSLVILCTLATISCGKATEIEGGLDNYVYVSGTFTQQDSTALTGTGTVRFTSTLPSINASKSIELTGEIYNTGSITAVFFSDNTALPSNRGVQIKFLRTASASLNGLITVNGVSVGILDTRLAYITPGSFSLILEVHNTPSASRVIVWKKDSVSYSLSNVEVDSDTASHLSGAFPSDGGAGLYSGLQLNDAHLTAAVVSDAKVVIP